jgi:hypothetical protein
MINAFGVITRKNRSAVTIGLTALATKPFSFNPAEPIAINAMKVRRTDYFQYRHAGSHDRFHVMELFCALTSPARWAP